MQIARSNQDLFDAIYRRKSVRRYAPEALMPSLLQRVKALAGAADRLYLDIPLQVHLAADGARVQEALAGIVGSYGRVRAPHYLVVTTEPRPGSLENIGYTVEEIVLQLTAMGIATCWIGGRIRRELLKETVSVPDRQSAEILVAFGYPEDAEDFRRRPNERVRRRRVEEIAEGPLDPVWVHIMDAVRYAPSAGNSQPWRFAAGPGRFDLCVVRRSGIMARIFGRINRVDAGIALRHLTIAAEHFGRKVRLGRAAPQEREGLSYVASVFEE